MMTSRRWAMLKIGMLGVVFTAGTVMAHRASSEIRVPAPQAAHAASGQAQAGGPSIGTAVETANETVTNYCTTCHNDMMERGGLSLSGFDLSSVDPDVETIEKMIRKLQAGLMPPPGSRRPDVETYAALISALAGDAAVPQAQSARVPARD